MRRLAVLVGLFLLLAWFAGRPAAVSLDRAFTGWLVGLPSPLVATLGLVWVLGALPVTIAALLAATWHHPRRWRVWAVFAAMLLGEFACKRLLATPTPPGSGAAWPLVRGLDALLNLDPRDVAGWLQGRYAAQVFALSGAFPSGHVARLTFAAAFLAPRARAASLAGIGALAGLAVVATGGHWLLDAIGGLTLAAAALVACGRLGPSA